MAKRKALKKKVQKKVQKTDRKPLHAQPKLSAKESAVKLAGALYVILGIVSVLSGIAMIYFSYYSGGLITIASGVLMQGNVAAFSLGISSVTFGVLIFLIGFGLWRSYKWAGIMALAVSGASAILSVPYIGFNLFSGVLSLMFHLLLIVLIYIGKDHLYGHSFY